MGRGDFIGSALETSIMPFSRLALETLNSIVDIIYTSYKSSNNSAKKEKYDKMFLA
jgi:hypothetical protein